MVDLFRYTTFRYRFSDSRGIYASFDEALKAAPFGALKGYDHDTLAATYRDQQQEELSEFEYPILYHLERILAATSTRITVLDFGGNTGIHYLRLRHKLSLENVDWVVMDLPAITRVGREVCRYYPDVRFINDLRELDGRVVNVMIANGSLQYVENFSDFFFNNSIEAPQHIIIGQLLLYPGTTFVTLQNGGSGAYYPQYVFNRDSYVGAIVERGYALIDSWKDYSNACSIPFHPERSVSHSCGLYLRR